MLALLLLLRPVQAVFDCSGLIANAETGVDEAVLRFFVVLARLLLAYQYVKKAVQTISTSTIIHPNFSEA